MRRTHGEFAKLADHLIATYPECIIPAVPPSVTSYGAGSEEDERITRDAMQHWFNIVLAKPPIVPDDEVRYFIESDFGYSPMVDKGNPTSGLKRRAIKAQGPPPEQTPELAAARSAIKQFYLDAEKTHGKLDKVMRHRRREPFPWCFYLLTAIRSQP